MKSSGYKQVSHKFQKQKTLRHLFTQTTWHSADSFARWTVSIISTVVFSFLSVNSYSNSAFFIFKKVDVKNISQIPDIYNSFEIVVNGTKINEQNKKYKILINKFSFDTIEIKSNEPLYNRTILTKLRSKEIYEFSFNQCSMFEIVPAKKHTGLMVARFISVNRDTSKIYLNNGFCFVDSNQIRKKDTTDYFIIHTSGYCPYAITSFSICPKDISDYTHKCNSKDCPTVSFHLIGGEMISIYFDYKTRKTTAKFDDYYKKKQNIKISDVQ